MCINLTFIPKVLMHVLQSKWSHTYVSHSQIYATVILFVKFFFCVCVFVQKNIAFWCHTFNLFLGKETCTFFAEINFIKVQHYSQLPVLSYI